MATKNGTIIVQRVLDESGNQMGHKVKTGQRFYTPRVEIEKAMTFKAEYDGEGLKK